jgi:hypothetical protein
MYAMRGAAGIRRRQRPYRESLMDLHPWDWPRTARAWTGEVVSTTKVLRDPNHVGASSYIHAVEQVGCHHAVRYAIMNLHGGVIIHMPAHIPSESGGITTRLSNIKAKPTRLPGTCRASLDVYGSGYAHNWHFADAAIGGAPGD